MFTNVLVIVKPADKTRRAYKRTISTRLFRGFFMSRTLKQVYQPVQQERLLNVSSGEDVFIGEANVFC